MCVRLVSLAGLQSDSVRPLATALRWWKLQWQCHGTNAAKWRYRCLEVLLCSAMAVFVQMNLVAKAKMQDCWFLGAKSNCVLQLASIECVSREICWLCSWCVSKNHVMVNNRHE